jgi:hypothetical protein
MGSEADTVDNDISILTQRTARTHYTWCAMFCQEYNSLSSMLYAGRTIRYSTPSQICTLRRFFVHRLLSTGGTLDWASERDRGFIQKTNIPEQVGNFITTTSPRKLCGVGALRLSVVHFGLFADIN